MLFSDAKYAYDAILKDKLKEYIYYGDSEEESSHEYHEIDIDTDLSNICDVSLDSSVQYEECEPEYNPEEHELYKLYDSSGDSLISRYYYYVSYNCFTWCCI
jgi:hypothetical protein